MKQNYKLLPLALLAAPLTATSCAAKKELSSLDRPNVVVIFADDMGYGDLSILNKDSKFKTPNMDALARSGITFTDAHTVSSVSTPSRYGLMTGEYSWRSSLKKGVTWSYSPSIIDEQTPTIATMLNRSGYTSACIGKWHLGLGWSSKDGKPVQHNGRNVCYDTPLTDTPVDRGFDYFYGMSASLDVPPYVIIENDKATPPTGRLTKTNIPERDDDPIENTFYRAGDYMEGESADIFLQRFADKTKETITEYNKADNPFFIYFSLTAPHAPIVPSEKFIGKSGIGLYGDLMLEVDDVVGQIVKHLKKEGILENTIIMLSSDNGAERYAYGRLVDTEHNSSAGFKGIKRDLWEGGHRVPFIVSWKGHFPKGKIIDQTVCLSDIYATLADITNTPMSEGEAQDSYSLMPLIDENNSSDFERDYTIHHNFSGKFAIRRGDWVLIEEGNGDDNGHREVKVDFFGKLGYTLPSQKPNGELFNLASDPEQRECLYSQNPEIVAELTAILDRATAGWNTLRDKK